VQQQNTNSNKSVIKQFFYFAIAWITIGAIGSISEVLATNEDLNTSDFEYIIHVTDVIPYYTYEGISKVLTNGEGSFEDVDTIRLIIADTNFYAVYNNGNDNTFQFAGIYENGNSEILDNKKPSYIIEDNNNMLTLYEFDGYYYEASEQYKDESGEYQFLTIEGVN
jgi:hypothetical protein